jgi:glyoxylase-like metal-dependent hydrolase (beta-lactamase superfamily II)
VNYTYRHIDQTSGIKLIDEEADARGIPRPCIIAHRNVLRRLSRYEASHGFNSIVQGQQFNYPDDVYPIGQRRPDEVYNDSLSLTIGSERFELFHGRGETDDATLVWLPMHRILASGDCDLGIPQCRQSSEGPALRTGLGCRLAPDAGIEA